MARATRSKPKAKEPTPEPPVSTIKPLPASTSNPPKLFVLPKGTSKDARIVTLDNSANGAPSRYYFCPTKGVYEFTRIAAPKKECRSWLITGEKSEDAAQKEGDVRIGSGYVNKSADLFVATPIDLLFLILPALAPKSAKDTKQHFLAFDDYLDKLSSSSRHWRALLSQCSSLKTMIEKRMRAVSDTVDAGDETMYRLSQPKLLALLLKKAERMSTHGLPPSLEEKFIKTALEIPIMNIKREDSSLSTPSTEKDSQTSTTTSQDTTLTTPDVEVPDETKQPLTTPPEIPRLLRLRTSLTYLSTSYLPATLRPIITTHLSSATFTPLTTHLAAIAALRSEAAALRSISDNISRKRAYEEDEEKIAEREEKKRKKEDEERRKKSESLAARRLKKVDTSGMKKMSSFFTKVATKK
ncbi:ribonuclease H2, subunit B [Paraphoma chrysanthemicola]|uniref:Ribonuclease H2 subunit B n=1 Tax=Paraphoma chrysanthemicola TaxID=798071 RepID=A0A8K0R9A4_9PLEO|nr:ribonuclease H2, subunit B [Paraphoma chrysanthemicola]